MPVPYTFANLPASQGIPLEYLDANFQAVDGGAVSSSSVDTVADFQATSFPAEAQGVNILGYYSVGVGALPVRRVASEPAHPWKFRSTDRFLPNGSTDGVNGGWWEGYALDGATLYPEQFGAIPDGTTDCYQAFADLIDYNETYLPYTFPSPWSIFPSTNFGFCVQLSGGVYQISQTLYFRSEIQIRGITAYGAYGSAASTLNFPANVEGLHFYSYITVVNPPGKPTCYGAQGSVLRDFHIRANYSNFGGANGWDGVSDPSGIHTDAAMTIENLKVDFFYGAALKVVGFSNCMNVKHFSSEQCRHGVFIQGPDTNAGLFQGMVISGCCRFGVYEGSFLGNTHVAHTATGNGYPLTTVNVMNQTTVVQEGGNTYFIIQNDTALPDKTTAAQTERPSTHPATWRLMSSAGGAVSPVWGQVLYGGVVYNVVPGQEANMWTSQPDVTPAVWAAAGAPVGGQYYIKWLLNWQPYVKGADYYADGSNASNYFVNLYSESGYPPNIRPPSYFSNGSRVVGGFFGGFAAPWAGGLGASVEAGLSTKTYYRSGAYDTPTTEIQVQVGGDGVASNILSWWYNDSAQVFKFRYVNTGKDLSFASAGPGGAGFFDFLNITGPNTTNTGRYGAETLPYRLSVPTGYAILLNRTQIACNQMVNFTPVTPFGTFSGRWGLGDFVFNGDATDADGFGQAGGLTPLAYRCVTNSSGGTGALFSTVWGVDDSGYTTSNIPFGAGGVYVKNGALAYINNASAPLVGCKVTGGGSAKVLCQKTTAGWLVVSAPPLVTTVSGLPAASADNVGARAFVTDANATTFLSTVAAGGSNKVPVVSDGANWLIG